MAYHRYIFTAPEKEALSNERLDIRLLYISKSRYDRNWQSILHSHAFAELFYVIHGTGVFQTENDSFPVVEDDLVLINPNVTHTEFSHGENALEYIVLGLDGISFRSANNTAMITLANETTLFFYCWSTSPIVIQYELWAMRIKCLFDSGSPYFKLNI